jgi:hypothetical protein
METRLYNDILRLQRMIENFLPQDSHRYYNSRDNNYYRNDYEDIRFQREREYERVVPNYKNNLKPPQKIQTSAQPSSTTTTTTSTTKAPEVIFPMKNNLKSLESPRNKKPKISTTTEKYLEIKPTNEFTFYWKLDNFPRTFENAKKHEVFSHVFSIKGLYLRGRAVLNLFESETLLIDIEHLANVDNSEKMEIQVSDGLVFKEIAEEKLFQYSFAIMDQANPDKFDFKSPIYWNNDDDNFVITNSIYVLSNYLKDNALLIKITIKF